VLATRVLDTNVVSFLLKRHAWAARYLPHLQGHTLAVSFMTVAELYEWGMRRSWGHGTFARLETTLRSYLVIPSSRDLCWRWGEVRSQRRAQPIAVDDAWIAATALHTNCDLVTHNPADFQGIIGLTIITEAP
jgi:tRNA(fMet)-specific endonuclease VapC